ncbi:MAG: phosphoribosylformylglycinamidine synthase subunit PurS [Thermodesulfobacteriota bacterium]
MLNRLEIGLKPHITDVQGNAVAERIRKELHIPVAGVKIVKVYLIQGLNRELLQTVVGRELLFDPVLHQVSGSPLAEDFDWNIQVGFKPGVTDNEGRVAEESLKTGLGSDLQEEANVYTASQYLIQGNISGEDAERIASELLANQLIEQYKIKSFQEWKEAPGFEDTPPRVTGMSTSEVETVPLTGKTAAELQKLSQDRVLALSLVELECIQKHYKNPAIVEHRKENGLPPEPLDAELEVLAQTWSEHCKHKIFNARIRYENREKGKTSVLDSLFKTYIQNSTQIIEENLGDENYCLSVFKDNAGVIRFDPDYSVCIKVETHNSPSALDPYGGALTGIVGVNRDPLGTGLGANLLCNTDVFCFASPFHDKPLLPRLLHPHRVLEGVRKGVEHGGNRSGIPTVNGALVFDERFLGKPLVFCGTVGLMPAYVNGQPSHYKKAEVNDCVVMVGGRVGKDGIHGATFSSEALHSGSPATAVQIGDPYTQRKMYDFLMQARDKGLYNAITDNGAGGLSSSVGEMAEDTGGCDIDLSRVPLKYDGLVPWEILLSEAQERMTLAVPESKIDEFLELSGEMEVESTVLGRFTDSGFFRAWYGDKPVADLEMEFLHHGLPQMELDAVWEGKTGKHLELGRAREEKPEYLLRRMLGRLNICSKHYLIRQYDHEVQGGSAIKPLMGEMQDGPCDAAVIRPVLDRDRGLVVSNGICPKYSDLDTYWMMAAAIDESIRNCVAAGGDPDYMAGVDNFCWCDPVQSDNTPDGTYKLAQLVRANQALSHYCLGFKLPCISGKDSMKNDYSMQDVKISIPPTVLFSTISVIPDVNKCLSSDFKRGSDLVYILGITRDELGGSELAAEIGSDGGEVPQVDLLSARERYSRFYKVLHKGLVNACHDLSDGGLAVSLAEMAIGGNMGVDVELAAVPACPRDMGAEKILYSESQSRLLVCVPPESRQAFEEHFSNTHFACIGEVMDADSFTLRYQGEVYLREEVAELRRAWQETMDW